MNIKLYKTVMLFLKLNKIVCNSCCRQILYIYASPSHCIPVISCTLFVVSSNKTLYSTEGRVGQGRDG